MKLHCKSEFETDLHHVQISTLTLPVDPKGLMQTFSHLIDK